MRGLPLGLTALAFQAPAWGHHSLVHVDVICTDGGSVPGLVLLPFVVLAAVGIVRAVARHWSAPRPPPCGVRPPRGSRNLGAALRFLEKER